MVIARKTNKKKAVLDASSAILLYKAGLHAILTIHYHVIMPESAFNETTQHGRTGSKAYVQLNRDNKIVVDKVSSSAASLDKDLLKLDQGERDCLILFLSGKGDFVVTDDGAAAKYCQKHDIPFVNALLIPPVLKFSGVEGDVCC